MCAGCVICEHLQKKFHLSPFCALAELVGTAFILVGVLGPCLQVPSILVATGPPVLPLLSCSVCCCLSEIEAKYDKKMKMLRDELDLRRKTEIHEVEERKNGQINMLMQRHEEAFADIKNYYNDITLNNLALINSLKVLHRGWLGWAEPPQIQHLC